MANSTATNDSGWSQRWRRFGGESWQYALYRSIAYREWGFPEIKLRGCSAMRELMELVELVRTHSRTQRVLRSEYQGLACLIAEEKLP